MLFPKSHIDEIKKQTGARPDALRPRLRPARALSARVPAADLPDDAARPRRRVAGQAGHDRRTSSSCSTDILNPKQLEGLRLLVTPFPQQQFNATDDRRTVRAAASASPASTATPTATPTRATHLVGDIRPQEYPPPHRHAVAARREHPAAVRLAARAEDRRGLHRVRAARRLLRRRPGRSATKKGVNILERGSQVHFMAEFQELLDFPPAPKLERRSASSIRRRRPRRSCAARRCSSARASAASATRRRTTPTTRCTTCRSSASSSRGLINGRMRSADGPIKTFPLRGIKDSPPYLHDGRLLTLEDTVEFFNLILEDQLTAGREEGPGRVSSGAVGWPGVSEPPCLSVAGGHLILPMQWLPPSSACVASFTDARRPAWS